MGTPQAWVSLKVVIRVRLLLYDNDTFVSADRPSRTAHYARADFSVSGMFLKIGWPARFVFRTSRIAAWEQSNHQSG